MESSRASIVVSTDTNIWPRRLTSEVAVEVSSGLIAIQETNDVDSGENDRYVVRNEKRRLF